jgi:hypothetical protein
MRVATVALLSLPVLASASRSAAAAEPALMRARASLSQEGLPAKSAAEAQDETEPARAPRAKRQPPPERT